LKDHRPGHQGASKRADANLVTSRNEARPHFHEVLAMLEKILKSGALAQARILASRDHSAELPGTAAWIAAQDLRHASTFFLRGSGFDPLANLA
jgi:hypothetical protein